MTAITIVDTGPIVAFLCRDDADYEWARAAFDEASPPLLTCEAVIAEACFLMRRAFTSADGVMDLLHRGAITIDFSLASEQERIRSLMKRYADTPMSLADACLVRMTELVPDARKRTNGLESGGLVQTNACRIGQCNTSIGVAEPRLRERGEQCSI